MNKLKKIILTILPVLLLLSCTTTDPVKTYGREYRLESFSVFDGSENLIQTVTINYNELFKPVDISVSDTDGEIYNRKTMEYTDSGKLSFLKNYSDDSVFVKTVYQYDNSDFLVNVSTVNQNETELGNSTYINDDKGNPLEWVSVYSSNNEKIHFVMEYDEQDRMIKSTELDTKGEVIYYSSSDYDDSGNEVSYTIYSPDGQIDQQLLSFYRDNALIRTEIKDESGNELFRNVYELNKNNKPVKTSSYNQYGDLTDYVEITYNEAGLENSRTSYNYKGNQQEKTVKEYDVAGNNTVLILYDKNNEIVSITRNVFVNEPLDMEDEEFNALVFKL